GSLNFPIRTRLQPTMTNPGRFSNPPSDAFIAKISPSGRELLYSTYLGGSDSDEGRKIAVDGYGNAYITGSTRSADFPLMNALFSKYGGGLSDAFVAKVNSDGSSLAYSTYLGGADSDSGNDIVVDSSGNAYLTGYTRSTNFPVTGALQSSLRGGG